MEQEGLVRVWTLLVVCMALLEGGALATHRRGPPGLLAPPPNVNNDPLPADQWFTQKLSHFDPSETRTWQQRYFVNDSFYEPGGPVFLMIGGEGEASAIWMVTGQWTEYAKQYHALCFQLEHRYYGKSLPTSDMSLDNLKHLSSMEALADLAHFTDAMNDQYALESPKWVAFGGSYPGSLAAWYRSLYPEHVHAAVSTSAPLLAKTNFYEFLQVVTDSIHAKSGDECYQNIQEAFSQLEKLLDDSETGWANVTDTFKLCQPLDGAPLNVSNLVSDLANWFEGAVQYNEDNRGFEGVTDANITVSLLCSIMNDDEGGSALERLAQVNQLMMKTYDQKCLDYTYHSLIEKMRDENFNSSNNNGMRQWIYQTCTEFGWYQSTDTEDQPFGHRFPLSFWIQQCKDAYQVSFDEAYVNAAVNATNNKYGARDIKVTRVVFVNGSIDPWHAMGLTKTVSEEAPVIYIEGTAHCANMYPAREEDPPQLVAARRQIGDLIGQWLQED